MCCGPKKGPVTGCCRVACCQRRGGACGATSAARAPQAPPDAQTRTARRRAAPHSALGRARRAARGTTWRPRQSAIAFPLSLPFFRKRGPAALGRRRRARRRRRGGRAGVKLRVRAPSRARRRRRGARRAAWRRAGGACSFPKACTPVEQQPLANGRGGDVRRFWATPAPNQGRWLPIRAQSAWERPVEGRGARGSSRGLWSPLAQMSGSPEKYK